MKSLLEKLKPHIKDNLEKEKDKYPSSYKRIVNELSKCVIVSDVTLGTLTTLSGYTGEWVSTVNEMYNMFEEQYMGYNPFRWYTKGRRKKPLKKSAPLLLKIRNGDFEYSPYFDEAKEVEKEGQKIYDDYMKTSLIKDWWDRHAEALSRSKMKRVKVLKLMEVADEEENKRLRELRTALTEEFGKDLWDKSLERQRGKGTTEDLYWWYKKQCKLGMTKSEYQIFKNS